MNIDSHFAGLKRAVRDLSSRHPAVRRLRVMVWRVFEGRRAERHP